MRKVICTVCGMMGRPKKFFRGSFMLAFILWLCLLLPGFIYTIWLLTTKYKACRECTSVNIVPVDSVVGKKLIKEARADKLRAE